MPTGAELFVQTLHSLEISHLFTLVGDHLNEVLIEAAKAGITIVDMRHESGVTHAADAWARIQRRPAVSLVTGGPGHTNSLTGIATAQLAGSPLIAVSGSRASSLGERQAFQDIDQVGMARPVVKWAGEPPNAAQIPFYLGRAYSEANGGRKGAVHLTIPVDLFAGEAAGNPKIPALQKWDTSAPPSGEISRLARTIESAERPLVIAGSGVWWSGAEAELLALIEHNSLPVYTITMAKGTIPDTHPLCMGYADPALNRACLTAYKEADLILVVGKRIDYRLALGGPRVFQPGAKIYQIDIHPQELGMNRKLELGICADVKAALQSLLKELKPVARDRTEWLSRLTRLKTEWQGRFEQYADNATAPLHPAAFFQELQQALPEDVLFSWDGGDFTHWGRCSVPAKLAGGWLRLGPLGTIGSALPNAIALQLAHPGRPVMMVTGDGSLGFYLAELDTLVRYQLPVVIVVGNDAGWGLERELQNALLEPASTVGCELRATDYATVMKGFGGEGETITSLAEVAPAVRRAFVAKRPYLLNVRIKGARSPFTDWQIEGKRA